MITVTATASCPICDWTAGPGEWADVDRAAERHTRTGHPTITSAKPSTEEH
jgi:hypothetical protein